jgi:transcriptional regulator GlxA family with amidase domain
MRRAGGCHVPTCRSYAPFQDLRVERAQSLLHGSGLDIEAIAAEVGYIDGATLRTLLRERLGQACANFALTCVDGG